MKSRLYRLNRYCVNLYYKHFNIMDINDNIDSPLELKISFKKLLEQYEVLTKSEDELVSA